jgi:hypothetical protein
MNPSDMDRPHSCPPERSLLQVHNEENRNEVDFGTAAAAAAAEVTTAATAEVTSGEGVASVVPESESLDAVDDNDDDDDNEDDDDDAIMENQTFDDDEYDEEMLLRPSSSIQATSPVFNDDEKAAHLALLLSPGN